MGRQRTFTRRRALLIACLFGGVILVATFASSPHTVHGPDTTNAESTRPPKPKSKPRNGVPTISRADLKSPESADTKPIFADSDHEPTIRFLTVQTKKSPGWCRMLRSAALSNVTVTNLGWGMKYAHTIRPQWILEWLDREKLHDDDVVLFTDGSDTAYSGVSPERILKTFLQLTPKSVGASFSEMTQIGYNTPHGVPSKKDGALPNRLAGHRRTMQRQGHDEQKDGAAHNDADNNEGNRDHGGGENGNGGGEHNAAMNHDNAHENAGNADAAGAAGENADQQHDGDAGHVPQNALGSKGRHPFLPEQLQQPNPRTPWVRRVNAMRSTALHVDKNDRKHRRVPTFDKGSIPILFNAEANCYHQQLFTSPLWGPKKGKCIVAYKKYDPDITTKWRYLNAGAWIGRVWAIRVVFEELRRIVAKRSDLWCDQSIAGGLLLSRQFSGLMYLDYKNRVFLPTYHLDPLKDVCPNVVDWDGTLLESLGRESPDAARNRPKMYSKKPGGDGGAGITGGRSSTPLAFGLNPTPENPFRKLRMCHSGSGPAVLHMNGRSEGSKAAGVLKMALGRQPAEMGKIPSTAKTIVDGVSRAVKDLCSH